MGIDIYENNLEAINVMCSYYYLLLEGWDHFHPSLYLPPGPNVHLAESSHFNTILRKGERIHSDSIP